MSRVSVKEEVLRWAVDRSGHTVDDLRTKFPKIGEWVSGDIKPTLRQLEALAKATMTPLGFLFLDKPLEERLPIPHFRTTGTRVSAKPSPDLIETVQTMQQRQEWMREFLIDQGADALSIIRSVTISERTNSVAQAIRRELDFEDEWAASYANWENSLRALRERIETSGILVVVNGIVGNNTHRKLDVEEFRGFVLVDDYAPLMFVNGADGKAAQMFTIAHELAHIFFGSSAAFDLRRLEPADNPTEKACDLVAAEFLIPERVLREIWPSARRDSNPYQSLARRFKVSELVAARRTSDLGLITKREFFAFYEDYLKYARAGAKKGDGGDFYSNQNLRVGKRFARAVIQATREGILLYRDAYKLTGLSAKTFEQYAEHLDYGVSH